MKPARVCFHMIFKVERKDRTTTTTTTATKQWDEKSEDLNCVRREKRTMQTVEIRLPFGVFNQNVLSVSMTNPIQANLGLANPYRALSKVKKQNMREYLIKHLIHLNVLSGNVPYLLSSKV